MLNFALFIIFLISTNSFVECSTMDGRRVIYDRVDDSSEESSEESIRNYTPKPHMDSVITFRESEQDYKKTSESSRKNINNSNPREKSTNNANTLIGSVESTQSSNSKSKVSSNREKTNSFDHGRSNEKESKNRLTSSSYEDKRPIVYHEIESNVDKTYEGVADFLMPTNDETPIPRRTTTTEKSMLYRESSLEDRNLSHRQSSSAETVRPLNSGKINEKISRPSSSFHQNKPNSNSLSRPSNSQSADLIFSTTSSTSKGRTKNEKKKKQRLCEQKYMEYMIRIFNDNDAIADGSDSDYDGRVLVDPGEYPHMTALGFEVENQPIDYKCGGSLISDKFVITAAHCTNLTGQTPTKVRIGDLNLMIEERNLEPQIRNVKRIFTHPEYRSHLYYNDIALLELEQSVEFTEFVRPIRLWIDMELPENTTAHAMGYGATAFGKARTNRLTDMALSIVPNNVCNRTMPEIPEAPLGIMSSQICARDYIMNRDTCQGDSGGPLQLNLRGRRRKDLKHYHLIGITSFGIFCRSNNPSVYTRVSQYLDWIEQIVWLVNHEN